ncbi:hypothetical protein FS749_000275 [Ceratobasidium sp. UAMH 11750]|nr:hypothetical protein FS749_000275 [Ceratobasidium sp. UAMH 11750]
MRNITRLELVLCVTPTLSDFRSLLVNNPQLETLIIEIPESFGGDSGDLFLLSDTTSIGLARLQTLVLMEGTFAGWCQRALQLIDAPNLISLRLDVGDWPPIAVCSATMEFLCCGECTFISPSLRHLSLGLFRCDSDTFRKLFTICSNLVRLDWVVEQNRTYSLMLSHPPWLLPKLSWMRISGAAFHAPLDYILSQTVIGRSNAGLPLRVVEVDADDWANVPADVEAHLRGMVEKIGPFENDLEMQSRVGSEDNGEEDSDSETASHEGEEWSDDA